MNKLFLTFLIALPLVVSAQDKVNTAMPTLDFSSISTIGWIGIGLFSLLLGFLSTRNPS